MNTNQLNAIAELKSTLKHCEAENLLIVVGIHSIAVADYSELMANGYYKGIGDEHELIALHKSKASRIYYEMVDVVSPYVRLAGDLDENL